MPLDMALGGWRRFVIGWSGSGGRTSENSIYGVFGQIFCVLNVSAVLRGLSYAKSSS